MTQLFNNKVSITIDSDVDGAGDYGRAGILSHDTRNAQSGTASQVFTPVNTCANFLPLKIDLREIVRWKFRGMLFWGISLLDMLLTFLGR